MSMKMHWILTVLLLVALLLWTLPALAEDAPENAIEMTRRMGNGINLGNTMEACNGGALGGNTTDDPQFYETM